MFAGSSALFIFLFLSRAYSVELFEGQYSDPNHPNCARTIADFKIPSIAKVFGADAAGGEGAVCDGKSDISWGPLRASVEGSSIIVDFSSKGGPSNLHGIYNSDLDRIEWEDGNFWQKVKTLKYPSELNGQYSDPNHPSCSRVVEATSIATAKINGADAAGGEGAACDGVTDVAWTVPAAINGANIVADFSSKGGPAGLAGVYNSTSSAIMWSDGNFWPKISRKEYPSVFNGKYSDPNHPSCARVVTASSATTAKINGADAAGGEGATCDGVTDVAWTVPAAIDGANIVADFSSKGGPAGLKGTYDATAGAIQWSDGNSWTKIV
jgi:hypothetical protein